MTNIKERFRSLRFKDNRTERRKKGDIGEGAAAKLLRHSGYKIIDQNVTFGKLEIDIVAKDNDMTVFCEVKTREVSDKNRAFGTPASAVTKEKQKNLIRAARAYISRYGVCGRIRFDIVEVYTKDGKIDKTHHIKHAFHA